MDEYITGYRHGMLAAAKICDDNIVMFRKKNYAGPRPVDSYAERFACAVCADAIREKVDAPNVGEKDQT